MSSTSATLNTGAQMPFVGLGTWLAPPGEVGEAVTKAIKLGYRHIDCAYIYLNEKEIGAALKALFDEGVVKREELFITSKLWNNCHRADLAEAALEKTLADLQLTYLDLYLIHWPMSVVNDGKNDLPRGEDNFVLVDDSVSPLQTWTTMESFLKAGKVKAIGVSNFNITQLQEIIEKGTVVPAVHQHEFNPYLTQPALFELAKKHNIVVTAYSPLGSPARIGAKDSDPAVLSDPVIAELASKHNKTPAQILLRWNVQHGRVVIPKSTNEKRLLENFSIFDFTLSEEEIAKIDGLNRNLRLFCVYWLSRSAFYPFADEIETIKKQVLG